MDQQTKYISLTKKKKLEDANYHVNAQNAIKPNTQNAILKQNETNSITNIFLEMAIVSRKCLDMGSLIYQYQPEFKKNY